MNNEEKIKLIYQIVLAHENSGKTITEFCLEKDILPKILFRWRQSFLKDSNYRNDEWIKIAGHIEKQTKSIYHEDILEKASKWLKLDYL